MFSALGFSVVTFGWSWSFWPPYDLHNLQSLWTRWIPFRKKTFYDSQSFSDVFNRRWRLLETGVVGVFLKSACVHAACMLRFLVLSQASGAIGSKTASNSDTKSPAGEGPPVNGGDGRASESWDVMSAEQKLYWSYIRHDSRLVFMSNASSCQTLGEKCYGAGKLGYTMANASWQVAESKLHPLHLKGTWHIQPPSAFHEANLWFHHPFREFDLPSPRRATNLSKIHWKTLAKHPYGLINSTQRKQTKGMICWCLVILVTKWIQVNPGQLESAPHFLRASAYFACTAASMSLRLWSASMPMTCRRETLWESTKTAKNETNEATNRSKAKSKAKQSEAAKRRKVTRESCDFM